MHLKIKNQSQVFSLTSSAKKHQTPVVYKLKKGNHSLVTVLYFYKHSENILIGIYHVNLILRSKSFVVVFYVITKQLKNVHK